MTTERTYRCNLCRETIKSGEDGYGVFFTSGGPSFVFKALHECENHICRKCVSGILAQPEPDQC